MSSWWLPSGGSRWSWAERIGSFGSIRFGWSGWGSIAGWCWSRECIASCAWAPRLASRKRRFWCACIRQRCGAASRREGRTVCSAWIRIILALGSGVQSGFKETIYCLCWDGLRGWGIDTFAIWTLSLEVSYRFYFSWAKYTFLILLRCSPRDQFSAISPSKLQDLWFPIYTHSNYQGATFWIDQFEVVQLGFICPVLQASKELFRVFRCRPLVTCEGCSRSFYRLRFCSRYNPNSCYWA